MERKHIMKSHKAQDLQRLESSLGSSSSKQS